MDVCNLLVQNARDKAARVRKTTKTKDWGEGDQV